MRKRTGTTRSHRGRLPWLALVPAVAAAGLLLHQPGEQLPRTQANREQAAPYTALERRFQSGPVEALLKVNPAELTELTPADRVRVTLEVALPEDYKLRVDCSREEWQPLTLLEERVERPVLLADNRVRQSRSYLLEPFLPGEFSIPPITVVFWRENGEAGLEQLVTEPIEARVRSLLSDNQVDIHEIRSPFDLPEPRSRWIWASRLGGLALLIVVGGGIWYLGRAAERSATPARPPHEAALEALERLRGALEQGEIQVFYQGITDVLRNYIGQRYGLRAPEWTTSELLAALKKGALVDPGQEEYIAQFLRHCDGVKFAKHQPAREDMTNLFQSCKRFIELTSYAV